MSILLYLSRKLISFLACCHVRLVFVTYGQSGIPRKCFLPPSAFLIVTHGEYGPNGPRQ